MEKVIEQIIKKIDEKTNIDDEDDYPRFEDSSYKAFKIEKRNFHKIENINSKKKIAFIDGGNAEILGASNFSLHLIRTYFTIYKDNKRISSGKNEFYALIYSLNENDKIKYKTEIFDLKNKLELKSIDFDSYDETIKEGFNRIKISKIAEIIRRFAEIKTAETAIDFLENGDFIVLDGDLEASKTNEINYFNDLYKKAIEKDIIVAAISKTTSLFTKKGNSVAALLNLISPLDEWFYHPVVEINNKNHCAEMFFVKLNKNAGHVFKLEIHKKQKTNASEIILLLKNNSKDPVFLGYPYGLIGADNFARISNNEKNHFKTLFISKIGKKYKKIGKYIDTLNAHEILDKIS